jgi:predicted PhzF superfamily epimerase YddE/YHI9
MPAGCLSGWYGRRRDIPYELCDVFTDRPLAGNALAVFTDADDLDGAGCDSLPHHVGRSDSAP